MRQHHHNPSIFVSLLLTLASALFGLGGVPVVASCWQRWRQTGRIWVC